MLYTLMTITWGSFVLLTSAEEDQQQLLNGRKLVATPTKKPSRFPTRKPTFRFATLNPTKKPSKMPSHKPTYLPSKSPSKTPSKAPSKAPSKTPSKAPSEGPSKSPSQAPSKSPKKVVLSSAPSSTPSLAPQCRYTYTSSVRSDPISDGAYTIGDLYTGVTCKTVAITRFDNVIRIVNVQVAIDHPFAGDLVIHFAMEHGGMITLTAVPGSNVGILGTSNLLQSDYPITFVQSGGIPVKDMGPLLGASYVICKDDGGKCTYTINAGVEPAGDFTNFQNTPIGNGIAAVCIGDWDADDSGSFVQFSVTMEQACSG
jgi:hypothetical protein